VGLFSRLGYTRNDFTVLKADYSRGRVVKNTIYVVETSHERTSYLGDIHYWKNKSSKEKLDLLVLKLASKNQVEAVSYSGSPRHAQMLFSALGGFCGGDAKTSMYWGKGLTGDTTAVSLISQVEKVIFREPSGVYKKG
ncbi:MAG: hypothetical protein M1587_01550, partial [Thaumarchaeota archaeon]|nr:hypothetical protein [Nitrososphaerota archaeon]